MTARTFSSNRSSGSRSGVRAGNKPQLLDESVRQLSVLARSSEVQIGTLSLAFQDLVSQSGIILELASGIVQCIEGEGVRSVLPQVRSLGAAAMLFVDERLEATAGILETVTTETKLLKQLSLITGGQSTIALKTRVLTMLTNVEVGRLGSTGAGFQHLAVELSKFSKSLSEDTEELILHTEARGHAIEITKRVLSAEIPHLKEKFTRIEASLAGDVRALDEGLTALLSVPNHFRSAVQDISAQIAGVVSAIQSHDITRQQIEHVQEALPVVEASLSVGSKMYFVAAGSASSRDALGEERGRAYAGLTVQIYQLQSIKETVKHWTGQVRSCMQVLLNLGGSELVGISPLVLEQEREVSAKLGHIELLEEESVDYSAKIRTTVGSHSSLVDLVGRHVEKSRVVSRVLHLLSINSIIEASRLGDHANAILEIGNGISDLSSEWSKITDQSEVAMQEILRLVEETRILLETFSEDGDQRFHQAQSDTRTCLLGLRTAAAFAAQQTAAIQNATRRMQSVGLSVSRTSDLLEEAYHHLDTVLETLEKVRHDLETSHPEVKHGYDPEIMETLFAASYTTETEREVLRAALHGRAMPDFKNIPAGNEIELF
jgi:hypothetical protein